MKFLIFSLIILFIGDSTELLASDRDRASKQSQSRQIQRHKRDDSSTVRKQQRHHRVKFGSHQYK